MMKRVKRFRMVFEKMYQMGEIFRNIGIQKRLIGAFLLISIIPLAVTGIASYRNSNKAIQSKIETYSVQLMKQLGNNVSIELDKLYTFSKDIANSSEMQNLTGYSELDGNERLQAGKLAQGAILKKIEPIQGYVGLAEMVMDTGNGTLENVGAGKDYFDKSSGGKLILKQNSDVLNKYIKASMDANGKICMGFDDLTGLGKEIVFARLARSNSSSGGDIGTLIFSVTPDFLTDIYRDLNLGGNAQTFVIDQSGTVISSKVPKEIGSAYREKSLIEKIRKDAAGKKNRTFALDIGRDKFLAAYSTLGETGWYAVSIIPYSYLEMESNGIRNNILLWGLICLHVALGLSYMVTGSISNPLGRITGMMDEAKTGNLRIDIQDKKKDEIAAVSKSFQEMLSNIRSLIMGFDELSVAVLQNAERIAASSRQLRNSSELTSNVINQIASGATEQAIDANNCVEYMNDLSGGIDGMRDDTSHISEQVVKTRELCQDTYKVVNSLKKKTYETSSVSEQIASNINTLNCEIKEISRIAKFIAVISEQTNLLSLNASIEAARAGEAGKGFAVVADEVKKLASQSKEASSGISSIIKSIQAKSDRIVVMTNTSGIAIEQELEAVEKTYDAFKRIFEAMEDINKSTNNTSDTIQRVFSSRLKTLEAIEGISSVSQETAATIEEISAGIMENLNGIQDLADSSGELSDMASRLKSAIEKFRV